jgi:3-hydroxy-9,10-secoandrosta-1,3,5(10)-triene-9,17-dione monooxygenase
MTTIEDTARSESALAAVRELVPTLRERAPRATQDRRLPEETIADLLASGALKTIQAKRNGGYGLSMRSHLDTISTLARGCGSTAWVAGVVHAHSWLLSHFPAEAQDDIYGAEPDTMVSAVIGPRGQARKAADGYVLSGTWPFASGSERSRWLLLGGTVVDDAGAGVDEGDFAIPTSEARFHDDWYVAGLAGTGSCSVSLDELKIPAHRFLSLPQLIQGDSPGMQLHEGWLERCAPVPVLALALTGTAIGLSRQALEDFPALVTGKPIAYASGIKHENPVVQADAAQAASLIDQGAMLLYRIADELDEAARSGQPLDLITRARMRLDCAQGVHNCLDGVQILFQLSGASGLRSSSPLTRALADLQAVNQHGLLDLRTNREMYGRLLLGVEPNTPLI